MKLFYYIIIGLSCLGYFMIGFFMSSLKASLIQHLVTLVSMILILGGGYAIAEIKYLKKFGIWK